MKSPEVNIVGFFLLCFFFSISRQLKRERFHSAAPKIAQKVWMLRCWRSGAEPQQCLTEAHSRGGGPDICISVLPKPHRRNTHIVILSGRMWGGTRCKKWSHFTDYKRNKSPVFITKRPFSSVMFCPSYMRSNYVQHVLHASLNSWYLIAEYIRIQI